MKETLLSICVTAIITAVYRALAPTDRFGSQIKLLIACFFAVSVINAVSGELRFTDISDIIDPAFSCNDYSVQLDRLTAEETANNLKNALRERLGAEGISPEKIYIDVNIRDNGSISISEIKLVFSADDYERCAERAVVLVQHTVGTGIKVTAGINSRSAKEREGQ